MRATVVYSWPKGKPRHRQRSKIKGFADVAEPKMLEKPKFRGNMPKIIVEVMPKADLLDPQGKAVASALQRGGNKDVTGVRIGKRIELHFDRPITDTDLSNARKIADEFLSNAVIEDVVNVTVEN